MNDYEMKKEIGEMFQPGKEHDKNVERLFNILNNHKESILNEVKDLLKKQ